MPIRPYYDLGGFTPTGSSLASQPSSAPIPIASQPLPAIQRLLLANSGGGGFREGMQPGGTQPGFDPASLENPVSTGGNPYGEPRVDVPTTGGTAPFYPAAPSGGGRTNITRASYTAPGYPTDAFGYPIPGAVSGGPMYGDWAANAARTPSIGWNPSEGGILGKIAGHLPQLAPYFAGQSLYKAGRSLFGGIGDLVGQLLNPQGSALPGGGYPVPGGGDMANAAGDWMQNAARQGGYSGDFAGTASNIAAGMGFGGGLASAGGGGWQTLSELPGGLGSSGWQQALSGGGGPRVYQL
jgi:hypothetical protein